MEAQSPRGRERTYVLPKDALEGDRLDLQHHLLRYALKGDYAAPIEGDLGRILDAGSGTGVWGEEMALDFPNALIVDLDLDRPSGTVRANLPTTPTPNHPFVQGNLLSGLPFGDHTFDFTHQRLLSVGIPQRAWPDVIRELVRVTRPGGWIELLESGFTLRNGGPGTIRLMEWGHEFFARRGIDLRFLEGLGKVAAEAGLREVESQFLDLPLG